jgi:hypothetical protein
MNNTINGITQNITPTTNSIALLKVTQIECGQSKNIDTVCSKKLRGGMDDRDAQMAKLGREIVMSCVKHDKFMSGNLEDRIGIILGMTASNIAHIKIRMTEIEEALNKLINAMNDHCRNKE